MQNLATDRSRLHEQVQMGYFASYSFTMKRSYLRALSVVNRK